MSYTRILCLDGGGVRGVYTAAVLASIEENHNVKISDYFDLIVGTSTGGILALGLALGLSATELCNFYISEGAIVFSRTGLFSGLWKSSFDTGQLRQSLRKCFGNLTLKDAKTRVVVTAYNASRTPPGPHLFKTHHSDTPDLHSNLSAVDLALATAAAPTYFAGVSLSLGESDEEQIFLDGGIWANSPVLVGLTEAVRFLSVQISDIHMLSVGTGYKPFDLTKQQIDGGLWQWALQKKPPILDLLLDAQQAAAIGTVNTLLEERHKRIQRIFDKDIEMDCVDAIEDLVMKGRNDGIAHADTIVDTFCSVPAVQFVSGSQKII